MISLEVPLSDHPHAFTVYTAQNSSSKMGWCVFLVVFKDNLAFSILEIFLLESSFLIWSYFFILQPSLRSEIFMISQFFFTS